VASFDLLDNIRSGKVKLEGVKNEELPPDMQKMNAKERRDHLEKVLQQRGKLLREASELDRQRMTVIQKELARNKESFDSRVLEMLRNQSLRRVRY